MTNQAKTNSNNNNIKINGLEQIKQNSGSEFRKVNGYKGDFQFYLSRLSQTWVPEDKLLYQRFRKNHAFSRFYRS